MKVLLQVMALLLLTIIAMMTLARRDNSGWIAFNFSARDGHTHLFLMTGDGDSMRPITSYINNISNWSPDGKWLLVDTIAMGSDATFIFPLLIRPSGELEQYLQGANPTSAWSPDSRNLAVIDHPFSLYIVSVNGNSEHLLSPNVFYGLQWSPDGQWIYGVLDGTHLLSRVSVQTGEVEPLIDLQNEDTRYDLSPDGSQIVAVSQQSESYELIIMNADSTYQRTIWTSPRRILAVKWSPNGEWIAFTAGYLYRIRPDGSDLQRLTQQPLAYYSIDWSPDGNWIAFADGERNTPADLFRVSANGLSVEKLTNGQGHNHSPQYAPRAGLRWHPFWLMSVAIVLFFASMIGRLRR